MKLILAASAVLGLSATLTSAAPTASVGAIHVPIKKGKTSFQPTSQNVIFSSLFNGAYFGMIQVGTPPQTFPALLDTGSADFWLYAGHGKKKVNQLYYPGASSTGTDTHKNSSIEYADLSTSAYEWQNDVAVIAGRTVSTSIGAAYLDLNPGVTIADVGFDNAGLLGLGWTDAATAGFLPPVQKMFKDGLIASDVFSLYLGNEKNSTDGEFTVGGLNPARFAASDLAWNPVGYLFNNHTLGTKYWNIVVDAVDIKGVFHHKTTFPDGHGNNGDAAYILDSGTSFLALPQNVLDALIKVTNAGDMSGTLASGGYAVDCKYRKTAPTLTFTIGGKAYDFLASEYIGYDPNQVEVAGTTCFLEAYALTPPYILGGTFLRKFYSVYDTSNRRTGLAKAIHA
ncbi:hypothetical protein HKX48_002891 [Thoreauomyces humboldtii]|nr:hypothetical protein HKX48_002891 [Thoreauomyces humboldtii]